MLDRLSLLVGVCVLATNVTFASENYNQEVRDLIKRNKIHNANKKRPAAGCFIPTNQGVVVAINKRHNDIQLPMGKVDTGENPRATARREALEEVGINVMVMELAYTAILDRRIYLYRCKPIHGTDNLPQPRGFEVIILNPDTMVDQNNRSVKTPWRYYDDRTLLIKLWNDWKNGVN